MAQRNNQAAGHLLHCPDKNKQYNEETSCPRNTQMRTSAVKTSCGVCLPLLAHCHAAAGAAGSEANWRPASATA